MQKNRPNYEMYSFTDYLLIKKDIVETAVSGIWEIDKLKN